MNKLDSLYKKAIAATKRAKVHDLESDTPILPDVVAERIVDEVEEHFGTNLSTRKKLVEDLANRARTVYQNNTRFQKLMRGASALDHIDSFMRHWLSTMLKDQGHPLYAKLTSDFKRGLPLR